MLEEELLELELLLLELEELQLPAQLETELKTGIITTSSASAFFRNVISGSVTGSCDSARSCTCGEAELLLLTLEKELLELLPSRMESGSSCCSSSSPFFEV